jgi:hypothetical protein
MQRLRSADHGISDHAMHHASIIMHHNHDEKKPQIRIETWGFVICESFEKRRRAEAHFFSGFLAK